MNNNEKKVKNIFKNGEYSTTKERYTEAWAELIGRMEKDKTTTRVE